MALAQDFEGINARDMLTQLTNAGKIIIIVDFLTPRLVRQGIKKLGIDQYIDSVIETQPQGDLRKGKPKVFALIQKTAKENSQGERALELPYEDMTTANTAVVGHQNADLVFANEVEDIHGVRKKLISYWLQGAGGDFDMCDAANPAYTIRDRGHLLEIMGISLAPQADPTTPFRP